MNAALDLCTAAQVRGWLGLNSGLSSNASQTTLVSTTIASAITPGLQTVSPASMVNISVGMVLGIDIGTAYAEYVSVTTTATSTFTANFALAHPSPGFTPPVAITVTDQTDIILGQLITAASLYWLWRVGAGSSNESVPTSSPFVSVGSYDEWYDGNGNDRLYLLHRPVVSVTNLYVCGVSVPQSTSFSIPGWVVDQDGRSIVLRYAGMPNKMTYGMGSGWGYGAGFSNRWGSYNNFCIGTQNIEVQYTAGYSITPYDVSDAVIKLVGYQFNRAAWVGMKQTIHAQTLGTRTFADWFIPPEVEEVIQYYRRLG